MREQQVPRWVSVAPWRPTPSTPTRCDIALSGFVVLVVSMVALGALAELLVFDSTVGRLGLGWTEWIARHRVGVLDTLARVGSSFTDTWTVIGNGSAHQSCCGSPDTAGSACTLPIGFALELTVFLTVSTIIGRERPDVTPLGSVPSTSSFPSAMSPPASCCTGTRVIAASITRSKAVAQVVAIIAVVLIAFVASSRVYEGVHHPTDVIGGAMLGMGALFVAAMSTGLVVATRRTTAFEGGRTARGGGAELVIVAGVVIGVGVVAGVAATAGSWRWSRRDPTDPHLERRTDRRFLRQRPSSNVSPAAIIRSRRPPPEAMGLAAAAVVIGTATAGAILLMIKTRSGFARADTPFAHSAGERDPGVHRGHAGDQRVRWNDLVVVAALAVTGIELRRDRRWTIPAFVAMTIGGQFLL